MTTPTDDNPELITVIAYMRARPGDEQALRDALMALIEPTSKERGLVNYDLHEDIMDPAFFALYENWATIEAHNEHMATPHLKHFGTLLHDLLDDNGLNVHQMRRIA
ncbi:MAG TPA: antibiotic biosynthesis monooxygenase family protein [Kineosporiaceae bacterium]|nr:antibiotic biosynthesis monooxygenase family protein [Kineosporiaceae bacterium]